MFSRVTHRPDLEGLNTIIFPQGPYPGQIIEVTGDEGTGKTLLVTDFLARCLLPKSYKDIQLPGKNCGAIFVNCNHHFDLFRLAEILQYHIKENYRNLKSNIVQEIINNSLKNLAVINCYTNEQFQATLLNLESLILQETNNSLLIMDTIASFYWIQRIHSNISYNAYYISIINSLKSLASKFNITVVYTKPVVSMKEQTKKHVDITIRLRKNEDTMYELEVINHLEVHYMYIKYNIQKTINFLC